MAEITALRKYPCPECGGDAEWSASKQALVCPYCGTIVPWTPGKDALGETIRETELAAALSSAGSETRNWRFDKREVKCQSCQAITVFEASRAAQSCEFCGSPSIVPVETTRDAITPTAVLPAKLSEPQVRDRLRQWYSSRMFAPDRFKKAALLTPCTESICLTGPLTLMCTRLGRRWPAMSISRTCSAAGPMAGS